MKRVLPKGLKPVHRTLATGERRTYWYHRATGQRLTAEPDTAEGLLQVAALDARAARAAAALNAAPRSFAALWVAYRDSPEWRSLKPRTRDDYQAVRDWLGPAADRALVPAITAADVLKLRDKAARQRGRRFGNYVLQVIRLVLEWGRPRGWRPDDTNPAMGLKQIRRPTGARQVNRAWTVEELQAFLRTCPHQLVIPFMLGLYAGMREGDALRLTWSAYDGAELKWGAGKNDEPCTAPVTGVFKQLLDVAKAHRKRTVQVALNSRGAAWSESGFRASFFKHIRALKAEGLVRPGLTFHGLRHTVGSGARDGGVNDFGVAAALGDRSTHMAGIYGRDAAREAAQVSALTGVQKRLENIGLENALENVSSALKRRRA